MKNPDRVDLSANPNGLLVVKYWHQNGQDIPDPNGAKLYEVESRDAAAWGLMAAVSWLEDHGYMVRKWPYGARAFKVNTVNGVPWPIRTVSRITQRRRDVEQDASAGRLPNWFAWHTLDFAFDM